MTTRSKLTWAVSSLLLGIVFGSLATYLVFSNTTGKAFKNLAVGYTLEKVWFAKLLRDGKNEKVLEMVEGQMPNAVGWFTHFRYNDPEDIQTLWEIRKYYEKFGLEIPESARPTLLSLPPEPPSQCRKADNAEHARPANPTPPGTSAAEQPRVPGSGGG